VLSARAAARGSSWPSPARAAATVPPATVATWLETAVHLVDHVIPPVAMRQWVISVPKRLRAVLADRPAAIRALTRIFPEEIERLSVTRDASVRITRVRYALPRHKAARRPDSERLCAAGRKTPLQRKRQAFRERLFGARTTEPSAREPLTSSESVADVPFVIP